MAIIYKCDRCGCLMDKEPTPYGIKVRYGIFLGDDYCLCEECTSDLKHFMNNAPVVKPEPEINKKVKKEKKK